MWRAAQAAPQSQQLSPVSMDSISGSAIALRYNRSTIAGSESDIWGSLNGIPSQRGHKFTCTVPEVSLSIQHRQGNARHNTVAVDRYVRSG